MYCCIVIIFEFIICIKKNEFLVWPAWMSEFGFMAHQQKMLHTHAVKSWNLHWLMADISPGFLN